MVEGFVSEDSSFLSLALQFVANTLGGYASYQIGQRYGPVNLDGTPKESGLSYGEHKLLHGVVGGLSGGILNASKSSKEIKQGMLSGATGAMAAEIFIEAKTQDLLAQTSQEILQKGFKDQGGLLDRKAFMEEFQNALQKETLWSQVVGSSAGALVGKDANTAYWTSSNAVENNFLPTALQVGLLFYTAHDIYQTYQEHGALAALQKIQDEALLVATGYGCWKVAGKVYVDANLALKAYLSHSPALASAIGKISGATSKILEGVKERVGMAPSKVVAADKKPIHQMSDKEFAQSLANRADKKYEGIGPRVGQQKHEYAEKVANRYQKMFGERQDLLLENRFKNGEAWEKGMGIKDSVIPDVYNKNTGEVFDYKFGNAALGNKQIQKLQEQMPKVKDPILKTENPVTVTQIKPNLK